ncbi:MAG: hypothetical protein ABI846_12525 [Rudaea sp.]
MRWIMLLLAVAGFALAFTTKSPGLLGFGLLVGVACSLGFCLALAAARISANAQPESMLIVDPEVSSLRARTQKLRQIQSGVRTAGSPANQATNDDRPRSSF